MLFLSTLVKASHKRSNQIDFSVRSKRHEDYAETTAFLGVRPALWIRV